MEMIDIRDWDYGFMMGAIVVRVNGEHVFSVDYFDEDARAAAVAEAMNFMAA